MLSSKIKMPAHNGRFGATAAVASQKRQCKFETLYPAGSFVEAATTPSRWDVIGNAAKVQLAKPKIEIKKELITVKYRV